jgi:hypothetical protein
VVVVAARTAAWLYRFEVPAYDVTGNSGQQGASEQGRCRELLPTHGCWQARALRRFAGDPATAGRLVPERWSFTVIAVGSSLHLE